MIHFVSLNAKWVDEMRLLFDESEAAVSWINIQSVSTKDTVFVSPANCMGYMDGGIDYVYTRMFPGIQELVQQKIQSTGIRTILDRPYLPIGSAIIIPYTDSAIISAPTMFLPQDVSASQYAYHSFLATLILFHTYRMDHPSFHTLVVTSHCCGFGKMAESESAKQMHMAYVDYMKGNYATPNCENGILRMPAVPGIHQGDDTQIKEVSLR